MNRADVEKLCEEGFITAQQRDRILERFPTRQKAGYFLNIIAVIGGILIAGGITLILSANWDRIPRGAKIAGGLGSLLAAHAGGYYLREVKTALKTAEGLHLAGSLLFLANIALIGQIYQVSSRPANAFLAWMLGVAPLPWLLRSRIQHLLFLLAFGIWFSVEISDRSGWFYSNGTNQFQLALVALLGLIYIGFGQTLRRGSYAGFAPDTEKFGLLIWHLSIYPFLYPSFYGGLAANSGWAYALFTISALLGLALLWFGLASDRVVWDKRWRWTWNGAFAGIAILLAIALGLHAPERTPGLAHFPFHWVMGIALFTFCLVQVRVGISMDSAFLVNAGIGFIALDMVTVYLTLFGTMHTTGLMFVISGVLLIGFGIYLEKKRRDLLHQMRNPSTTAGIVPV